MSSADPLRLNFGAPLGPGRLITIDGIDGCGKTTLVRLLERCLLNKGTPTVVTRLPTTEMRGSRFFELLQRQGRTDLIDPLAFELEYMVDRIQHCRTFIEPALRKGSYVITDRYALSSIGSLLLRLPSLRKVAIAAIAEEAWFKSLCRYLIRPDLSFLVHADAGRCADRLRARVGELDRDIDEGQFAELQAFLFRVARANEMVLIDTSSSPEESLRACLPYVEELQAVTGQVRAV